MTRFYVQLHLLDACNLRCKHCYQKDNEYKEILTLNDCKKVFDDIDQLIQEKTKITKEEYKVQVNLTGGEPLLYSNLYQVIDEIKRRGWLWALLSNGTLADQENVKMLASRHPVFIQVSLEGNQEINDQIRGEGTYVQIIKAIQLIKREHMKVLVSFTINSTNWRNFPEVARICRKAGVDKLWCDRYVGEKELSISTSEFRDFLGLLRHEMRHPRIIHKTKVKAERSLQFLCNTKKNHTIYQCGAGGNLIVITANGDVMPCRRLPIILGNIREESLSTMLSQSKIFGELKKQHIPDTCIKCKYRSECRGGAKCVTYAQTGKLFSKDVNCPLN